LTVLVLTRNQNSWMNLCFNVEKCKTIHLGEASQENTVRYEMKRPNGQSPHILDETKEEKDLGVVIRNNLKSSAHIAAAVNKANKLLRLIRSFTYMDTPLMKQLYTFLVRPQLEFGNVIWNPCLKGKMDLLERVQHRATRMIPGTCQDGLRGMAR